MVEAGVITAGEARRAPSSRRRRLVRRRLRARDASTSSTGSTTRCRSSSADRPGSIVETTLDLTLQAAAESSVRQRVNAAGRKRKVRQGAVVALDGEGRVRAWSAASPIPTASSTAPRRQAPGGLGLQALRLPDRHGAGADARRASRSTSRSASATGRPRTTRGSYLGPSPCTRRWPSRSTRSPPGSPPRSAPPNVAATAHRLGITSNLQPTPRWRSARRKSRRSRWPRPTRPSPTAAPPCSPMASTRSARATGSVLYEHGGDGLGQLVSARLGAMNQMMRDVVTERHRHAAPRSPATTSPARPAPPRIIATPGSSAIRPISSPASGSATTTIRRPRR